MNIETKVFGSRRAECLLMFGFKKGRCFDGGLFATEYATAREFLGGICA